MKKGVFVLLLIFGMVLAPLAAVSLDTAELTLATSVSGIHEIGIFTEAVSSTAAFTGGASITESIAEIDPAGTTTITTSAAPKYLAVRTNQKGASTLSVSIGQLLSAASDELDYSMVFATAHSITGATIVVDATGKSHTITIPAGSGLRLYNFPFHFEIAPAQFSAAVPASYSATITFTYTSP